MALALVGPFLAAHDVFAPDYRRGHKVDQLMQAVAGQLRFDKIQWWYVTAGWNGIQNQENGPDHPIQRWQAG